MDEEAIIFNCLSEGQTGQEAESQGNNRIEGFIVGSLYMSVNLIHT